MDYTVKYDTWEPYMDRVTNIVHFKADSDEEAGAKIVKHIAVDFDIEELEEMNEIRQEDGDDPMSIDDILETIEDRGLVILKLINDTTKEVLWDGDTSATHEMYANW